MPKLALGLDSSTQSLTGVLVDIDHQHTVWQKSLNYASDNRLNRFGINTEYILPPAEPGQANQPAAMYLASLDAMFSDMARELPDYKLQLSDIRVINTSGQQHGHVLLHHDSPSLFAALNKKNISPKQSLPDLLAPALALPWARIWRTSCTQKQADHVRNAVGGKQAIIELTGSNAPLRFSAFGIRKTAQDHPEAYQNTHIIHQISSLIPAVLCANADIPLDYGNACGASLMDYRKKQWSDSLLSAVADDLPEGKPGLSKRLPPLQSALTCVGTIADYFVSRYGFNSNCAIAIGSGDNPQTKVLVEGSLLSLGTSFVNMVETDGNTFDLAGYANAMYDALDRPFMFGCRTNGALRWDAIRTMHDVPKHNFAPAEAALRATPPGNQGRFFLWQAETESFPVSRAFEPVRINYDRPELAADYAGIIESTLASVYLHSRSFMAPGSTLYVAGGATDSPEIMRRVAAMWNRRVVPIEKAGAALGAAVSGACTLLLANNPAFSTARYAAAFLRQKSSIAPRPEDVKIYHDPNGFLHQFEWQESKLLRP